LTPRKIVNHLQRHPPGDFTLVTLGPKPLRLPHAAPRKTAGTRA